MAPRRPRSTSNVSAANGQPPRLPTSSPQLRKQFVAASDSIFQNNLTVLRRRDPSILTILDQFSHVCLYHFNGKKWEKQGYEGSMFLVEYQEYPQYGLFILNRMGTGDYGRRIYPEDDMEVVGDYLMYRYYPDYTQKRTDMQLPYPLPAEYRPIFDKEFAKDNSAPNQQQQATEQSGKEKKGNSVTIGLWMFPTDARESLKDVIIRLHSYVKRGERYPDEYRYGPGRPPPPNPHGRSASQSSAASNTDDRQGETTRVITERKSEQALRSQAPHPTENGSSSEVDKLFAKLQPPSSSAAPAPSRSVQSWFAALSGQEVSQERLPSPAPAAPTPSTSTRGLALLDTIFASVTPSGSTSAPSSAFNPNFAFPTNAQTLPPHPEDIQIVSPKPTSSTLPQVLNQNVISTLLGLGADSGSRASSAAPSCTSSRRSGPNRYEGDNEFSESDAASEGGYSTSSTVLDLEADPAVLAAGSSSGFPVFSYPQSVSDSDEARVDASRRMQGDVTPRVMHRGIPMSPPLGPQGHAQSFLAASKGPTNAPLSQLAASSSAAHPAGAGAPSGSSAPATSAQSKPAANTDATRPRTLVPFEPDSELWPYPRAPLDDRAREADDSDVVELDFSDTRALSDPAVFSSRLKEKHQKQGGKTKSRRQRAAERERERDAIEKGWDDPVKGQMRTSADEVTPPASVASSSGAPPVTPAAASAPVVNGKGKQVVNGTGAHKAPVKVNGTAAHEDGLQREAAHAALLSAVSAQAKAPARELSRKQFVQEVLSLIYSDNNFVDKLWQEYTARTN